VVPLAIYILTFMIAFGRRQRAMPRFLPLLQALSLAAAGIAALMGVANLLALGIALLVFTLTALTCHLELASSRPQANQLTRYFLLISIGGALGRGNIPCFSSWRAPSVRGRRNPRQQAPTRISRNYRVSLEDQVSTRSGSRQ
jgi:hypothetical protein